MSYFSLNKRLSGEQPRGQKVEETPKDMDRVVIRPTRSDGWAIWLSRPFIGEVVEFFLVDRRGPFFPYLAARI